PTRGTDAPTRRARAATRGARAATRGTEIAVACRGLGAAAGTSEAGPAGARAPGGGSGPGCRAPSITTPAADETSSSADRRPSLRGPLAVITAATSGAPPAPAGVIRVAAGIHPTASRGAALGGETPGGSPCARLAALASLRGHAHPRSRCPAALGVPVSAPGWLGNGAGRS